MGRSHKLSVRVVQVELEASRHEGRFTVSVRSRRSRRVLFSCTTSGARNAEFAMLSVERLCAERGYVLVMPAANDNHAAAPRSLAVAAG